jgi:deoxyribodipyrimidine photolyase
MKQRAIDKGGERKSERRGKRKTKKQSSYGEEVIITREEYERNFNEWCHGPTGDPGE